MSNKHRIILDTNVLLVSISSKSKTHWIFKKLLQEEYELVISNEILTEYEEVISRKFSSEVADNIIRTLLLLPNVGKIDIYYRWNLVPGDEDDNKFIDCAVASNADYLVTNDKDFNILKEIGFPSIEVIDIPGFKKLIY
jgi:putative PIN family toxin of toxin-antitoxin system